MDERPYETNSVDMRKGRNTENGMKTGDYTLPPKIEEDLERDWRLHDEYFAEKQMEYEIEWQANLYNL